MAKGKCTFLAWHCSKCGKENGITTYKKHAGQGKEFQKQRKRYCSTCRKRLPHKGKDVRRSTQQGQ